MFSDTIHVTVRTPEYPVPDQLSAIVGNNTVNLNWSAPETRPVATFEVVTEDFESYEAFTISDMGDWTLIDLDKDSTLATPRLDAYPNQGAPMAFQVFNTDSLGVTDDDVFTAHSGLQYVVSAAANNKTNNDWLISPLLSAKAQTISFWAKEPTDLYGNERMVVWYSTTDKHPDSFIKLSEGDYVEPFTFWKNYSYALPQGARYFAIQCVSEKQIFLYIDDVTFEKADGDPETINLSGYNVYCNDKLLTATPVTATQYTDVKEASGTYTYKVTALYDKGESVYSNQATVDLGTSVTDEMADHINVYADKGTIHINNATGKSIRLIAVDGRELYQIAGQEQTIISSQRGIFLVQVGEQVKKVFVP